MRAANLFAFGQSAITNPLHFRLQRWAQPIFNSPPLFLLNDETFLHLVGEGKSTLFVNCSSVAAPRATNYITHDISNLPMSPIRVVGRSGIRRSCTSTPSFVMPLRCLCASDNRADAFSPA